MLSLGTPVSILDANATGGPLPTQTPRSGSVRVAHMSGTVGRAASASSLPHGRDAAKHLLKAGPLLRIGVPALLHQLLEVRRHAWRHWRPLVLHRHHVKHLPPRSLVSRGKGLARGDRRNMGPLHDPSTVRHGRPAVGIPNVTQRLGGHTWTHCWWDLSCEHVAGSPSHVNTSW